MAELEIKPNYPVVGRHARITPHTGKTARTTGFTKELRTCSTTSIDNYDVIHDCVSTGRSIIFLIHNALYFKAMNHNTIPPFMMKLDGLEVEKCTNFLVHNPTVRHHYIFIPDLQLHTPLQIEGIISYLPTRRTDASEERKIYQNILTNDTPEWNPHEPSYSFKEINMVDDRGKVRTRNYRKAKIFGLNLDPVPDLQLNDESIYDSEVYKVLTEVNPELNMDAFSIDLNGILNRGSFVISIGSFSKG